MNNKTIGTKRIKLKSPYGYLTTVGNGKIVNGSNGLIIEYNAQNKYEVLFDGYNETVRVPCHWIEFESDEQI